MDNPTASRNLLMIHSSPEHLPDWTAIKQRINATAPDIDVAMAPNQNRNSTTARWQVRRPSLVFSPVRLIDFVPRGGTVYCGHLLGKDEQARRLTAAGVATPRTEIYSRDRVPKESDWGEYVILKPDNLNSARGVKLVRTRDIAARHNELAARLNDQFLVQSYIDHTEDGHPTAYRLRTMFGRALYCGRNQWVDTRRPIEEIADDPRGIIASNGKTTGGRARALCFDADVISLAERAHAAFPECPVLGIDIVRDSTTGQPYVLEVNPHGHVWHFGSAPADYIRDCYAQFNLLDLAADLLIEKTRTEAS